MPFHTWPARGDDPASRLFQDVTESAGVAVHQNAPVPWFKGFPMPLSGTPFSDSTINTSYILDDSVTQGLCYPDFSFSLMASCNLRVLASDERFSSLHSHAAGCENKLRRIRPMGVLEFQRLFCLHNAF